MPGRRRGSARSKGQEQAIKLTNKIVHGRPDKVEANLTEDAAREVESGYDVQQIRPHEDNVGRFDGDVGSSAESDADIGDRESRRVVDPVPDLIRARELAGRGQKKGHREH